MKKVIVIGAGVIGAATTCALSRHGIHVSSLDRARGPGREASFANGGMLTPSMSDPWNAPGSWRDVLRWIGRDDAPMLLRAGAIPQLMLWGLSFLLASNRQRFDHATALNVRLALYSLDVMAQLRGDGLTTYDNSKIGTVKIYRDENEFAKGIEKAKSMHSLGVQFNRLSVPELVKYHPVFGPIENDLVGGVYFPKDESGDAQRFTKLLLDKAAKRGASLRWKADVKSIILHRGKACGVVLTGGEEILADGVVIAAGAYSDSLAKSVGIRLMVKPVKGYSLTFPVDRNLLENERLDIPTVDDGFHAAITPLGDRVRVAGTAEFCGFDTDLTEARLDNLRYFLTKILPEQAPGLLRHGGTAWAGLRPMHSRGTPVIGETSVKALYLNTGHGHLGWTLAAGSAQALADNMLNVHERFDISAYR